MRILSNRHIWWIFSLFSFLLGVGFFIYAALTGNVDAGLFLVFPVVFGMGWTAALGVLFIVLAMLLFMFGHMMFSTKYSDFDTDNHQRIRSNKTVEGGGVVFIGPIPVVVSSNWKIALFLMIAAILILITIVVVLPLYL